MEIDKTKQKYYYLASSFTKRMGFKQEGSRKRLKEEGKELWNGCLLGIKPNKNFKGGHAGLSSEGVSK